MAVRQLSAIYLAAASAYTVAIALSQHPVLATQADRAANYIRIHGTEAAIALETHVLAPGWKLARDEAGVLEQRIADAMSSPARKPAAETTRLASASVHPQHAQHVLGQVKRHAIAPPPIDATDLRGGIDIPPAASPSVNTVAQPPEDLAEAGVPVPPRAASRSEAANTANSSQQVARADMPRTTAPLQLAPQAESALPPPNSATPETATPVPNLPPPSAAELASVEQRLKDSLSAEMLQNFELFLYVSKAANGPLAQRMYVFKKEPSGDLTLAYNWPVSTGRERVEFNPAGAKLPSITPTGYYELDPKRSFVHYRSVQWGQPMPYAMFFNWKKNGYATGLAIHSATGDDVAQLGTRASAGCVRLSPEAARTLFTLIRSHYRGLAPRFAIDRRTGTMSNDGIIVHDSDGHVQLAEGYKVLVFIENYGGENLVAALF